MQICNGKNSSHRTVISSKDSKWDKRCTGGETTANVSWLIKNQNTNTLRRRNCLSLASYTFNFNLHFTKLSEHYVNANKSFEIRSTACFVGLSYADQNKSQEVTRFSVKDFFGRSSQPAQFSLAPEWKRNRSPWSAGWPYEATVCSLCKKDGNFLKEFSFFASLTKTHHECPRELTGNFTVCILKVE